METAGNATAGQQERRDYRSMRKIMCDIMREIDHQKRVAEKMDRIDGLQTLLRMHEKESQPDYSYLLGLRKRLRLAETQLKAMRP